jgi:VanZ family protein
MHKTTATPLSLMYAVLILYASLYPFSDWRDQGIAPLTFLSAPFPRYWTAFDMWINVIGYLPFGALLTLSALRSGKIKHAVPLAVACACLLSLFMETIQGFLPARVASREDWLLNSLGALVGAVTALALEKSGAIDHWSRIRSRWFLPQSRGGLVLLAMWPVSLLFPPPIPFGCGQIFERLEAEIAQQLEDTPFLEWLPVRDVELQPLAPGAELLCIVLALLIPCLLGFTFIRSPLRRLLFVPILIAVGVATTVLSAGLSWGPGHMFAWLDLPCQIALATALVLACGLAFAPVRVSAALILLALGVYLSLLNQAPESPYFAQTLQSWEQGNFIRFNGLAQWFGWLWPYATLGYVLSALWRRQQQN